MPPASISNPAAEPDALPSRRALFAIFGAGLLGRLMATWFYLTSHPHTYLFSHPWEMGLLANTLLHHQGYSSPFGAPTGPTAFIAPGYPTLIAAIFFVLGAYTSASAVAILLMQIAFSMGTIWLIVRLSSRVFDARTATVAGAFWAVSMPLWFVPEIFWESAFSECALIAIVSIAWHYRRTATTKIWLLLGAGCALVSLVNPALLFSLVAILAWLVWQTRRVSWKAPILGLLALVLVYSPWPIRNAYRFHAFIPLRSTVGFELWMGNRPNATGRLDESIFPMFNQRELSAYIAQGEVAYTNGKTAEARDYIRSHPAIFLKLTARRIVRFWAGSGNTGTNVTYVIHALLTTCFGFLGLILASRRGLRSFSILMALPFILFPIPYYITHAEFRYRLNIDPLLTVLAAFAVVELVRALARRPAHTHAVASSVRA